MDGHGSWEVWELLFIHQVLLIIGGRLNALNSNLKVVECIGMWWKPDFETLVCPYLPPNIERPKECTKLFLVRLPASCKFIVPKNFNLLAIPLCQVHENRKTYGPIISGVPQLLSKFSINVVEP
nr:pre-mRNA cleavage factor Im 25 kDa subunit 1 isoform X1 [Ipomoea trifida]